LLHTHKTERAGVLIDITSYEMYLLSRGVTRSQVGLSDMRKKGAVTRPATFQQNRNVI